MSDTYVLLKALPFANAGTLYKKCVGVDQNSYCPDYVGMRHERFAIHKDYVENNPEWFKKEEPIDWEFIAKRSEREADYLRGRYNSLLNDISLNNIYPEKKYTKEDMRKCFNESRETVEKGWRNYDPYKWSNFGSYIDSLK